VKPSCFLLLREVACVFWVRRQWPPGWIDGALRLNGSGGKRAVRPLKVLGLKVEAVLLWSNVNQTLSTVRATSTLQSHWAADVHLEVARAKEPNSWSLWLVGGVYLVHGTDYKTCGVHAEEQVEKGDEDSRGEERDLCDSGGG
jgi:hypothetical protein